MDALQLVYISTSHLIVFLYEAYKMSLMAELKERTLHQSTNTLPYHQQNSNQTYSEANVD